MKDAKLYQYLIIREVKICRKYRVTCMKLYFSPSHSLELTNVVSLESRSVNRRIRGKKYVDIFFEFEDESPPDTSKDTINSLLHQLVSSARNEKMEEVPGLYHQLVLLMQSSKTKTLMETMKDIWNCHGNNSVNCDSVHQVNSFFLLT